MSGTVGAFLNTLIDLGWTAPTPMSIRSSSGKLFEWDLSGIDPAASTSSILRDFVDELGESIYKNWWAGVGDCPRSGGLEGGVDLRSYRTLESKWSSSSPGKAGMLRVVARCFLDSGSQVGGPCGSLYGASGDPAARRR